MGIWMRHDTDAGGKPDMVHLSAAERWVLLEIRAVALIEGEPTWDASGKRPLDMVVDARWMSAPFLARRCNTTPKVVRTAIEKARSNTFGPPSVTVGDDGRWTVVGVAAANAELICDRRRKQEWRAAKAAKRDESAKKVRGASGDDDRTSADAGGTSSDISRTSGLNGTVRDGTVRDGTTVHVPAPRGDAPTPVDRLPSPEADGLSRYLLDAIRGHTPSFKASRANVAGWAREIDLMLRRDGRMEAEVRGVIDWCHKSAAGQFWRSNILSGGKLREQFDRLKMQMAGRDGGPERMGAGAIADRARRMAAEEGET